MNLNTAGSHYALSRSTVGKKADKHLDVFSSELQESLQKNSPTPVTFYKNRKATHQGALLNKCWDLIAVSDGGNKAATEFKSITASSFGKHYSSRVEECLGVALDARTTGDPIWLGYIFFYETSAGVGQEKNNKQIQKATNFIESITKRHKMYNYSILITIDEEGNMREVYGSISDYIKNKKQYLEKMK